MKRTQISSLTPQQASDELVFAEFKKLLLTAKKKYVAALLAERAVFNALEDMCIDAESIETSAENASNLMEAITCYLCYDEYSVAGIMKEVRAAYGSNEKEAQL